MVFRLKIIWLSDSSLDGGWRRLVRQRMMNLLPENRCYFSCPAPHSYQHIFTAWNESAEENSSFFQDFHNCHLLSASPACCIGSFSSAPAHWWLARWANSLMPPAALDHSRKVRLALEVSKHSFNFSTLVMEWSSRYIWLVSNFSYDPCGNSF